MVKAMTLNQSELKVREQDKIIICNGEASKPARFWMWRVCTEAEFTETMKKDGWCKSMCTKYLSSEQLIYLEKK